MKLPEVMTKSPDIETRKHHSQAKAKMKEYADSKSYVKLSEFQVGDSVYVKQDSKKSDTPYHPTQHNC